jgi:hypothetical protein
VGWFLLAGQMGLTFPNGATFIAKTEERGQKRRDREVIGGSHGLWFAFGFEIGSRLSAQSDAQARAKPAFMSFVPRKLAKTDATFTLTQSEVKYFVCHDRGVE